MNKLAAYAIVWVAKSNSKFASGGITKIQVSKKCDIGRETKAIVLFALDFLLPRLITHI